MRSPAVAQGQVARVLWDLGSQAETDGGARRVDAEEPRRHPVRLGVARALGMRVQAVAQPTACLVQADAAARVVASVGSGDLARVLCMSFLFSVTPCHQGSRLPTLRAYPTACSCRWWCCIARRGRTRYTSRCGSPF